MVADRLDGLLYLQAGRGIRVERLGTGHRGPLGGQQPAELAHQRNQRRGVQDNGDVVGQAIEEPGGHHFDVTRRAEGVGDANERIGVIARWQLVVVITRPPNGVAVFQQSADFAAQCAVNEARFEGRRRRRVLRTPHIEGTWPTANRITPTRDTPQSVRNVRSGLCLRNLVTFLSSFADSASTAGHLKMIVSQVKSGSWCIAWITMSASGSPSMSTNTSPRPPPGCTALEIRDVRVFTRR